MFRVQVLKLLGKMNGKMDREKFDSQRQESRPPDVRAFARGNVSGGDKVLVVEARWALLLSFVASQFLCVCAHTCDPSCA